MAGLQDGTRAVVAVRGLPLREVGHRDGADAGLVECSLDAVEAPPDHHRRAGVPLRVQGVADDGQVVTVPGLEELPGHGVAGRLLIGEDGRGDVVAATVHGHGGDASRDLGKINQPRCERAEDEPVDLPVHHRLQRSLELLRVTSGLGDQHAAFLFVGDVEDAADHRGGEARDGDLVRDEADRSGLAEPQGSGGGVRAVVEVAGGLVDASDGVLRQP